MQQVYMNPLIEPFVVMDVAVSMQQHATGSCAYYVGSFKHCQEA